MIENKMEMNRERLGGSGVEKEKDGEKIYSYII